MKTGEEWLWSKEKRSFDMLFSSTAATLAAPLGIAALAAVMIENHHFPLFLQERVGNPEQELWIPKIRTLAGPIEHRASKNGHHHERATGRLSRLVRKMHIDETPQFWLVTSGKMSAVGPRPIVKEEYEVIMDSLTINEQADWIKARTVKPGLVNALSPAQHTSGYVNNPRDVAEADISYMQEASWKEDKRIIQETTRAVLFDLFNKIEPAHPSVLDSEADNTLWPAPLPQVDQ